MFHNIKTITINKTDREDNIISKPKVMLDYNDTMGGVDQHLHDYPIIRKRGKNYYKNFCHLLEICICNAYVLYTKNDGENYNLDFRIKLVERLIQIYHKEVNV